MGQAAEYPEIAVHQAQRREYHLITLMGLREAGERHHDLNGDDPDVSAKAAGHSKETKARYYKKVSYEEAQ